MRIIPLGAEDSIRNMNNIFLNNVVLKIREKYGAILPENAGKNYIINIWGLIPEEQNIKRLEMFTNSDNIIFVPTKDDLVVI